MTAVAYNFLRSSINTVILWTILDVAVWLLFYTVTNNWSLGLGTLLPSLPLSLVVWRLLPLLPMLPVTDIWGWVPCYHHYHYHWLCGTCYLCYQCYQWLTFGVGYLVTIVTTITDSVAPVTSDWHLGLGTLLPSLPLSLVVWRLLPLLPMLPVTDIWGWVACYHCYHCYQ